MMALYRLKRFRGTNCFSKKEFTGRARLMRQEYKPKRRTKITKLFFRITNTK